jgi:hypothetical protein
VQWHIELHLLVRDHVVQVGRVTLPEENASIAHPVHFPSHTVTVLSKYLVMRVCCQAVVLEVTAFFDPRKELEKSDCLQLGII